MKKIFKREYLLKELNLPYKALDTEIVGFYGHSARYKMIFRDNGKYYRTYYFVGDWIDYFNDKQEIECEEVKEALLEVWDWVPVED